MMAARSPPGRSTRVISAMTRESGAATIRLIEQVTTSTVASRSGICEASARSSGQAPAERATASSAEDKSKPTHERPPSIGNRGALPQPRSATRARGGTTSASQA